MVQTEFLRNQIRDNRRYNSEATSIRITRSRGLFAVAVRGNSRAHDPYGGRCELAGSRDGLQLKDAGLQHLRYALSAWW